MTRPAAKRPEGVTGRSSYPRSFIPFTHCLSKRLDRLIREERSRLRHEARELTLSHDDGGREDGAETQWEQALDWRDPGTMVAQARDREDLLLEAIGRGGTLDPWTGLATGSDDPGDRSRRRQIEVDGETIDALDIIGLAEELETSVGALQKHAKRRNIAFTMREGIRHYPLQGVEELRASLMTNVHLAEVLGVSTKTVQRWKRLAPPGLSNVEMVQFLGNKARKRGRSEVPPEDG